MLNTLLLNTHTLNTSGAVGAVAIGSKIAFNGYEFETAEVITNEFSRDNAPNRDLVFQKLPRANGQVLLSDFWGQRTIVVRGVISAETRALLDVALREMKTALSQTEKTLIIPDGESQLIVNASWSNTDSGFDRDDHYKNTYCEYRLVFVTSDNPFLSEPSYSSEGHFALTSLDFSEQANVIGNGEIKPVFILIFSTVIDVDHIKISNNTTGESIEADVTISNGSIVEVSTETLEFSVDGSAVDYDGFPVSLKNGANSYNIELTKNGGGGSPAASYDLTLKWKNTYL